MKNLLNNQSLQISFIGGGNMAKAMVGGLIKSDLLNKHQITVSDKDLVQLENVQKKYGVNVTSDNIKAAKNANISILAVKPYQLKQVSDELKDFQFQDRVLLSVLAGTSSKLLKKNFNVNKIVRVMPNTPCLIGEGMSAWFTNQLDKDEKSVIQNLLESFGKQVYFENEKFVDISVAICGSGPSYIFLLAEAIIDSGVYMGISRDQAQVLAYQTIYGSIKYAIETQQHPVILRNQVTSPGGTTAHAIKSLEKNGFRETISEAIIAAYNQNEAIKQNLEDDK